MRESVQGQHITSKSINYGSVSSTQLWLRKNKNKKSKERYNARLIRKKYKLYSEYSEKSLAINLSSHALSMSEVFALELGYGFVPTPANKEREEEMLILEGLRFIDRIGKIDSKITYVASNHSDSNDASGAEILLNHRHESFVRDKKVPRIFNFLNQRNHNLLIK